MKPLESMAMLRRYIVISTLIFMNAVAAFCQWEHTGIPFALPATSVAFIGTNTFASTNDGNVYRSTDNGASWKTIVRGLATTNGGYLLATVGSDIFAGNYYGVFRSTDLGTSWKEVDSALGGPGGENVKCLTVDGGKIFASVSKGLYVSTDNGQHWAPTGLLGMQVNALVATNSRLIAGTGSGVLYSTDGGVSWELSNSSNDISASVFAFSDSTIFAGGGNYPGSSGIYRSTDGALDWSPADSGLVGTSVYVNSFAVIGHDIFAGTSGGVYLSTDDGLSWRIKDNGLVNTTISTLGSSGVNLFAGTGAGLYRSTDSGLSWTVAGLTISAMSNAWVESLVAMGTHVVAGTEFSPSYDGYLSTDNGDSWSSAPIDQDGTVFVVIGTRIIMGSVSSIYVSADSGATWSLASYLGVNAFAENNGKIYAATNGGLYVSSDTGSNWTAVGLTSSMVYSVASAWGYLFAGTNGLIYRSSNGGTTWSIYPANIGDVTSLAVSDTNLLAGSTAGAIILSPDSGKTWLPVGQNGLTNSVIAGFVVYGTNVFTGTADGVFLSTDSGYDWGDVSDGLGITNVTSIAANDTFLFVGTHGGGVWRRPISQMVTGIDNKPLGLPNRFSLSQNYPNPFNPSTIINYQLPVSSHVTLKVYDVLGRIVKTLVDERENAGSYSVTFNADGLASGVYFYRLQARALTESRGMVILR